MKTNTPEAYEIEEGETVTLRTHQSRAISGTCIRKRVTHPDYPNQVWEQRMWVIETSDGKKYEFGRIDGLSPAQGGGDAYPSHFPLERRSDEYQANLADEDKLGYIMAVHHD